MFVQDNIEQKITSALGENISEQELRNCIETAETIDVPVAKLFWQVTEAEKGLYIVLDGKVRLLDYFENLVTTLSAGESFGEATLFEQQFIPYAGRASHNLKICFLKQEVLQSLMDKYPKIRQKLLDKADIWDLLLLCRQNSQFPQYSSQVSGLLQALSLFEKYKLEASAKIPWEQDFKLWLLHRGEILNSDNELLTLGKIYSFEKQDNLQVVQPTIAYFLKQEDLQTALQHCPELAEFITTNGDRPKISPKDRISRKHQPPRKNSSSETVAL